MLRMAAVSMTLIVAGLQLFELNGARAQDIAGMEDCTKTPAWTSERAAFRATSTSCTNS